ncbi:UvrD-helicase domain-containing protein [Actinomyces provencensis]|uniref:UvrD-helicase domain-containing protein n=1 Tax=Actinomyces provencensis TaxID=1720198 RepID=UPI001E38E5FB|nr:UvrD-helicase domain-containing protein [Actinomyces provencensis]
MNTTPLVPGQPVGPAAPADPAGPANPAAPVGPADLSAYTIIRASAGSGKTYSLVQLLTERLRAVDADGQPLLRPDQVIATTFTIKAAGELSTRIREHLVEEGLLEQAAAVPTALIGSVNSITGRILQDFAMDAGLSPELSVLTEQAGRRAFTIATSDILAEAEEANRPLLARTGYDLPEGDDPLFSSGRRNWASTVRVLVDLARANDIDQASFDAFARASAAELRAALEATARGGAPAVLDPTPTPAPDLTLSATPEPTPAPDPTPIDARARVADMAGHIAATLRDALDAGEINKRSVAALQRILPGIESFATAHTGFSASARRARERLPWKDWFRAATGYFPDCANPTRPIQEAVDLASDPTWFARDPQFRADMDDLITLVLTTARRCLGAYAQYKTDLGLIDFVDQEHLTLHLLRSNSEVRAAFAGHYRILVVDEFQDTSPLELALFTELGALVREVIWVGDPKQSIYAFRGSDPALMGAAVQAITRGGGHSRLLRHSWRSHEVPLALTNTVFSRLFPPTTPIDEGDSPSSHDAQEGPTRTEAASPRPGERNPEVWLDIPAQRAREHAGGEAALWQVQREPGHRGQLTNSEWYTSLARGISDARERDRQAGVSGSWAVLTRTNQQVADIQSALRAVGIPCVGGGTPLLATREGATLRAALSWLVDPRDTQSLIEVVMVVPEHPAHTDWLQTLSAAPDVESRRGLLERWAADLSLAPVRALATELPGLTVKEAVVALVDALDLRRRIAEWGEVGRRSGAVVGVVRAAEDYMAEADSAGHPATLSGFLAALDSGGSTTVAGEAGADAVTVSTTHQAKGLEWDSVVLALPDRRDRFAAAGSWVQATGELSMSDPLAGRSLRFWPETALECDPIAATLAAMPAQEERRRVGQLESRRLFYVACTRAKRRLVLAPKHDLAKADVFDGEFELAVVEDGLEFRYGQAGSDAEGSADTGSGCDLLDCQVLPVPSDAAELADLAAARRVPSLEPAAWVDVERSEIPEVLAAPEAPQAAPFIPATFTASGVEVTPAQAAAADIRVVAHLGDPLVRGGGPEWDHVGDCVHAYLAAPLRELDAAAQLVVARRLVRSCGVGAYVQPADIVDCGARWTQWREQAFPGADASTEVPFTWTNPAHQRTQGWLDQLVSTKDGRMVVVDHKTYPGSDPLGHVRRHYVGQMATYREAVSRICSVPRTDVEVLIHLPLLGLVVAVDLGGAVMSRGDGGGELKS